MTKRASYHKAFKKLNAAPVVVNKYVPTWTDETIEQYEDFIAAGLKAEEELEVLRSIAEETHTAWVDFDASSSVDEELSEDEIEAMNASFISSYERELPRHMRDSDYL